MKQEIPSYAITPVSPVYLIKDRKHNPSNYFKQSKTKQFSPNCQRPANNSLCTGHHIDFLA